MVCNGSRLMEGHVSSINEPNVTQDEGNAVHWLIEQAHRGYHTTEELIDRKAPNGVFITADMIEHADDYLAKIGYNGDIEYETSFNGENWEVLSRVDNIEYFPATSTLIVDDFKYGWAIVDVKRNWTLIAHAIGYCLQKQITPGRIVFRIHQPRPYHPEGRVRSWEITYDDLTILYNELNWALSNLSDKLATSPHCYKCPALATCPAARLAELNAIDASERAFEESIDNQRLSFQLDHLDKAIGFLKLRRDAYEELAIDRIRKGEIINNYTVDKELTNRTWTEKVNVELMKILTGENLSKDQLVTPKQAEKRGVHPAIIKTFTTRYEKGMKLVRIEADRKAQKLFKERIV